MWIVTDDVDNVLGANPFAEVPDSSACENFTSP